MKRFWLFAALLSFVLFEACAGWQQSYVVHSEKERKVDYCEYKNAKYKMNVLCPCGMDTSYIDKLLDTLANMDAQVQITGPTYDNPAGLKDTVSDLLLQKYTDELAAEDSLLYSEYKPQRSLRLDRYGECDFYISLYTRHINNRIYWDNSKEQWVLGGDWFLNWY